MPKSRNLLLSLQGMALEMPEVADHPNAYPFSGVLTLLDEPSTRAPHGSDGHCVILPKDVAEKALPSLLGMAVNFECWSMDSHSRQKVGVITEAEVAEVSPGRWGIAVKGILYAADFPWEVEQIKTYRHSLGMSFELALVRVEDRQATDWRLTDCVFTGAAILLKDKAAYQDTSLAAAAAQPKENDPMEELLKQLLAAATAQGEALNKLVAAQEAQAEAVKASAATVLQPASVEANPAVDALSAQVATIAESVAKLVASAQTPPAAPAAPAAEGNQGEAQSAPAGVVVGNVAAAGAPAPVVPPQRQTISPAIGALLAKAGVGVTGDEAAQLDVIKLDAAFDAAGLDVSQRLAAKGELARAGLLK